MSDYEDVIKRLVEIKKQIDEMLVCLDGAEAEISHHLSFMPPVKSNAIKLDTK